MRTLTSKSTSETPFKGADRMSPLNSDMQSPLSSKEFGAQTSGPEHQEPEEKERVDGYPILDSPTENDGEGVDVDPERHLVEGRLASSSLSQGQLAISLREDIILYTSNIGVYYTYCLFYFPAGGNQQDALSRHHDGPKSILKGGYISWADAQHPGGRRASGSKCGKAGGNVADGSVDSGG